MTEIATLECPRYGLFVETSWNSREGAHPLSVAQLDRLLRETVEHVTLGVWVLAEVGALKIASSGHMYLTLKDETEDAVIDAVAYRDCARRYGRYLEEGNRVLVAGKATIWAPRGRLQFVVDRVRPAGRGLLLEELERRKQKLQREGLFDVARKKKVPKDARVIGVVTSASGAVIHDISRVAFRRGSVRILLAPALVQGDEAPKAIVQALDRLQRVEGLEVIIIGRGGGAMEDLMAFNDEAVVRCVAACRVPTVSAVGHEVDFTLTDLAADARAATPSQAAELVVADQSEQIERIQQLGKRLRHGIAALLGRNKLHLERALHGIHRWSSQVSAKHQLVDDRRFRLESAMSRLLSDKRAAYQSGYRRLLVRHPRAVLAQVKGALAMAHARMVASMRALVRARSARLAHLEQQLQSLSPLAALARGYAIVMDQEGRPVLDSSQVGLNERVEIRLHRGRLDAIVNSPNQDKI